MTSGTPSSSPRRAPDRNTAGEAKSDEFKPPGSILRRSKALSPTTPSVTVLALPLNRGPKL